MRLKLQLTIALLFAFLWGSGQSVITGKVTDEFGAGTPGVNILVKGTTNGTTTDTDGNYTLSAPQNSVLVFSFIGYVTQEVNIGTQTVVNIQLESDVTTLSELVVVGYGVQEKKDITGAVAIVDSKAFESRPNNQFGNLIQGKTSGVQVIVPSGKPSAGFSMRIRGTNSITAGSEPLYVVDGVPITDTRSINPADIENITVLKDASSAAIYGAQGANGVVLITTKRGKTGTPKFDLTAYTGISTPWKKLDVLNSEQYRDLMTEMGMNTDWSQYTANTDWQNEIFQNGVSQNYQLSVSGKTDETNYYISGGYVQQKGAVRSSEMERYNLKVNLDQKVNKWLSLGTNLNLMRYHDVDVSDNQAINQGGVILGMLSTPPNIGIFRPNGTYTSNPFQDWENPVASTDASKRGYLNERALGNLYAEFSLMPELKFKSNVGFDFSNGIYDYFLDPFSTSYGRAKQGIAENRTNLHNFLIFDNTLTYTKTFNEDHAFSALLGSVIQKNKWEDAYIQTTGFTGSSIPTTNAGSIITAARNSKEETANASFIARLTYDYKGKYLLTGNFRRDGSSKFGSENRYGYFPAFSLGWRLSEESFMASTREFVDDLKLRFGYGIVGNDNLPQRYGYVGRVSSGSNYPIGGVIQPGTYQSSIENESLKWEQTEQFNIGLDAAVLDSRVTFTVEAYMKNTSDLLLNVPLPRSTGFDTGVQNIGSLQNKGLEFLVNGRILTGDLTWTADFNISFNRNKIIDLKSDNIIDGTVAGRGDISLSTEGKPLGLFYGYVSGGVDPATGNAYYINRLGESTFDPTPDDRTFIGNPNPDFIYGFTNTLSYKNFDLNIFFQGVQGNDIFNATRIETEGMTDAKSQTIAVLNRWREAGDVTDIPKASPNNTNNSRLSTRFVEDGSFLRLKALTLGYNVPAKVLSRIKMTNAKIYMTGENLLTFTNYKGYDPEVNAFGASNTAMGVDFGTYPQTRNLIFGLNLSF